MKYKVRLTKTNSFSYLSMPQSKTDWDYQMEDRLSLKR